MNRTVLIIGKVWPEPKSSAAGTRMMQLIDFFQSKGDKITFASTTNPSEFQVDLEVHGIEIANIMLNCDSFNEFITELDPSIVIYDRFMTEEQFGWRVIEHCPKALRILNTEDLHFLRDARKNALKELNSLEFDILDIKTDRAVREVSAIYRSDISLMVSQAEIDLLKSEFQVPEHLLYYLPIFTNEIEESLPTFEERQDFFFIGNFLHEPNWDCVRFLKEAIWPSIRKQLPTAVLHVYGGYPSHKVFNLHNPKEGFLIHGRADDAREVNLKSRVCLAPVRFGAGIKGKFVEGMIYGTPNITTEIGAEDMQWNGLWNGKIATSVDAIIIAAVELYTDKDKWEEAQQNGFEIANNRFNIDLFVDGFAKHLELVLTELEIHRSKDYTSTLLQQQTLLSTRFMSKWIMEKNK